MEQTKETKQPKTGKKEEPDFIKQYRRCYPGNKTFYVTTDRMVFLEIDKESAYNHQKRCGGGEVRTY